MSAQHPGEAHAPAAVAAPGATVRQIAFLAALGLAVGLLAGFGASIFIKVEHALTHLLWTDIPEALGQEQAPWWLTITLLVIGALIVYAAKKLPGGGGHSPLQGLGVDIGPREVVSVLIAALGGLCFGAALGPEAPLMAVGTALGAMAFRDPSNPVRTVMMIAGAMAAIGAIFGNPLVTTILLLEMALIAGAAMASPAVLLPALAALASGYTLQVGVQDWSGLGQEAFAVQGLPAYPNVRLVDLAIAVPAAAIVAVIAIAVRLLAERLELRAKANPLAVIMASAALIAISAVVVSEITGGSLELVLFSGQSAMPEYFALTSAGSALVILIGRFISYTLSMGGGFRGGPIFPAVAMGAIVATALSLVISGASLSALAATGIAAAMAAALRMPFSAALLAVLLTSSAGGAITVPAIIGALVGMLVRLAAEVRLDNLAPAQH